MKTLLLCLLSVGVTVFTGQESFAIEGAPAPPGKETTIQDYSLWIPDGVSLVRGVIAMPQYEAGTAMYQDRQTDGPMAGKTLGYRDLARRYGLALFLHKFFRDESYTASTQATITSALTDLAMRSGHPEIRHAALITTGLSWGGYTAAWLAQSNPARIIGFFPIAGSPTDIAGMAEMRKVPALFINQGQDGFYPGSGTNVRTVAKAGRASGSVWGWHVTSPDVAHHVIYKHDLVIVWLEEILKRRVPANWAGDAAPQLSAIDEKDGWLVDIKWHDTAGKQPVIVDSVKPYKWSEAPGDKSALFWMPSERAARALVDYSLNDGRLPAGYSNDQPTVITPVPTNPDGGAPDTTGTGGTAGGKGGAAGAAGKGGTAGAAGAGGTSGGAGGAGKGGTSGGAGAGGEAGFANSGGAGGAASESGGEGGAEPNEESPSSSAGGACSLGASHGARHGSLALLTFALMFGNHIRARRARKRR